MTAHAATTMPDFTGYMVDRRYQLVRKLGAGTYGVVYQAVDTQSTQNGNAPSRAVKIIPKYGRKPAELAAARREIALHSLVSDHPNVVTVHTAYEDDHYFYIIMDFVRGGDLFEPVCRQIYVDNDALLRKAFISLVDAVLACHSCRVYHRDLKPENILVSEDRSQVYLADFGLATNRSLIEEFYCGTAAYMSPGMSMTSPFLESRLIVAWTECIGHLSGYKPYHTSHSDVWALGVILVNMISGRNPWERATLDDPCFLQFIENPDFLFDVLPISEGANDILRHAFVLNPLSRISLPGLRQAVLDLDTFFRYEDELSVIDGYVQDAAHTFGDPQPRADPAQPVAVEADVAGLKPTPSVLDAKSAVPVAAQPSLRVSCHPTLPVPDFPGFSSGSATSSTSSRGSSPASSLIVTPAATAVGPEPGCEEAGVDVQDPVRDSVLQDTRDPVSKVGSCFVARTTRMISYSC